MALVERRKNSLEYLLVALMILLKHFQQISLNCLPDFCIAVILQADPAAVTPKCAQKEDFLHFCRGFHRSDKRFQTLLPLDLMFNECRRLHGGD